MEDFKMPLNFIANMVLSFSFTGFVIFLFGRQNSKVYKLPWYKTISVKIGLATCTCAALVNTFTFSNPEWSEVLLNVGLAILFTWAAWFHYRTFVIPYKNKMNKKSPRRKTKKTNK
jgi:uncharacterized membrane protein YccC